jgi:aerobic-type carbon monoxide dehydrogenase small subunit (CoxS/CutS family)
MKERIGFTLDGVPVEVEADPMQPLADVLAGELGVTGLKTGCSGGDCGGCTVSIAGRRVNACKVAVGMVEGTEVETAEA